jgi:hypothetical protein
MPNRPGSSLAFLFADKSRLRKCLMPSLFRIRSDVMPPFYTVHGQFGNSTLPFLIRLYPRSKRDSGMQHSEGDGVDL